MEQPGRALGYREYARHRGVTLGAVQKAIKTGRIADAVIDGKKIDTDRADALWKRAKQRVITRRELVDTPRSSRDGGADGSKVTGPGAEAAQAAPDAGSTYASLRAIREGHLGRLAEIELLEKTGKLIDADKARARVHRLTRHARDMLQAIPDQLAPVVTGETDLFVVHQRLAEAIGRVCDELANARPV